MKVYSSWDTENKITWPLEIVGQCGGRDGEFLHVSWPSSLIVLLLILLRIFFLFIFISLFLFVITLLLIFHYSLVPFLFSRFFLLPDSPISSNNVFPPPAPPSGRASSSSTGPSPQFTWLEGVWMVVVAISYLMGYAVQISIVVERYSLEEPPTNRGLYIVFLLLPHIIAGLKNLQ